MTVATPIKRTITIQGKDIKVEFEPKRWCETWMIEESITLVIKEVVEQVIKEGKSKFYKNKSLPGVSTDVARILRENGFNVESKNYNAKDREGCECITIYYYEVALGEESNESN